MYREYAEAYVSALQFMGTALGISKSTLGLTVLAWGNSIADFVADTALARAGNPKMGAAGCFGVPCSGPRASPPRRVYRGAAAASSSSPRGGR